jgi:hypothetical protein
LSSKSGIGTATIQRMEVMDGVPRGNIKTIMAIRQALEDGGVTFTGTPEDSPGVCLNLRPPGS